jgi:glutamate 5-kinase
MRIVIKVGSSTLTHANGKLNLKIIDKLVRIISDINNQGHSVILVTSGAMAVGTAKLNFNSKPCSMQGKQAVASVGQCELMAIYDRFFLDYGYHVGQILLTKDVVENPERKNNVINTFNELLNYGCVPIVNENDSVEVEEIKFGENDTLSAIVAYCVKADLLILLTDIDALYDSDPRNNPNAKPIKVVEIIDDNIRTLAGEAGSDKGTGGMITKIKAAEIAMEHGIDMYIASGSNPEILYDILDGKEVGTLFKASK